MIGAGVSPFVNRKINGLSQVGAPTSSHLILGDSISTKPYAYTTNPNHGYAGLFDTAKGITANNKALSGFGIYRGAYQKYQNASIPNTQSCSIMMGLNDARSSALGEDQSMVIGGLASVMACHYASTIYDLNATATKVGTWVAAGGGSKLAPARKSISMTASQTVGNTLSKSFNGDAIAVCTLLHDVGSRGFTIHIDGVLKHTHDPTSLKCNSISAEANGGSQYFSPYAIVLSGLGSGAHTCLITITAGNGTYFAWFDYLIELYPYSSVGSTQPFVWLEVPRLNAAGYGVNAPNYSKASNSSIIALNNAVWASAQMQWFKGYSNFTRIQTNNYYNPDDSNQINADNVHPKEQGSQNIATPFIYVMS